jgi:hypothetical protein
VLAFNLTLGFMSDEEIRQQFQRTREALVPGGRFLLVMAGPKLIPGEEQAPTRNWERRRRKFILTEKRIEGGQRFEESIVIDLDGGTAATFRERQRALSFDDLTAALESAGSGR